MKKTILLLFILMSVCFVHPILSAQEAEDPRAKTGSDIPVNRFPDPVGLYHYNYFLAGTVTGNKLDDTEINGQYSKFQISIAYRMFLWAGRKNDTGLYFAYTQKSLWDLFNFKESSPFIESNYSPELFYRFDLAKKTILGIHFERLNYIQFGLWEHESNGLGGEHTADSRSWDRGYFEFEYELWDRYLVAVPKFWCLYNVGTENKNITRYMGYGQLTLKSVIELGDVCDLTLMAAGRKGTSTELKKGNMELTMILGSLQYKYRKKETIIPLGLYIQYFSGYGETLLQYNTFNRVLRAGFSFLY